MNLGSIFKNSLMLPKKESLFKLNRVSMRDTMVYIIILLFILFLPDMIQMIISYTERQTENLPSELYIVQVILLYPLLIVFLMVAGVSLLAAIAIPIKNLLKRKLKYQQLWKMTAFALTIPILIYLVLRLFDVSNWYINILPIIFYLFLMSKMIMVYPKRQ